MKIKLNFKHLPDSLSKLAQVALDDLIAAEKAENVTVYMHAWHQPAEGMGELVKVAADGSAELDSTNNHCTVCLAGAVMRGMGVPDTVAADPDDFPEHITFKFYALDALRSGNVEGFVAEFQRSLGLESPLDLVTQEELDKLEYGYVAYGFDPSEFKKWIRDVIKFFEKKGDYAEEIKANLPAATLKRLAGNSGKAKSKAKAKPKKKAKARSHAR